MVNHEKKWLVIFLVLMAIVFFLFFFRSFQSRKKDVTLEPISHQKYGNSFIGLFYPSSIHPDKSSVICFFTKKVCPSCVFETKGYADILYRAQKIKMKFETTIGNPQFNNDITMIPELETVQVDSVFLRINDHPIILKTDSNGVITSYHLVEFETPYLTRKFVFKELSADSIMSKEESTPLRKKELNLPITTAKADKAEQKIEGLTLGTKREVSFEIENTGSQPLIIQDVKTSCGCVTPIWTKQPILAGEKTTVSASIDPTEVGYFNKTMDVYCNTKEEVIHLKVSGTVTK